MLKTKSIHDPIEASDGTRILVSSIWPKFAADKIVDMWFPELGSPLELIKNWQGQKFDWKIFKQDYLQRLNNPQLQSTLRHIAESASKGNVTLIGHPKDSSKCHRILLKEYLEQI